MFSSFLRNSKVCDKPAPTPIDGNIVVERWTRPRRNRPGGERAGSPPKGGTMFKFFIYFEGEDEDGDYSESTHREVATAEDETEAEEILEQIQDLLVEAGLS